jgi:hypothetical protein
MPICAFLRARALFEAHQPRKAMAEIERGARLCEQLGSRRFLRPHALRAGGVIAYAQARRIANELLADLASEEPAQRPAKARTPRRRR